MYQSHPPVSFPGKMKNAECEEVHLRPLHSATALAACSSALPGSGTVGPAGKPSHSEGQCWLKVRENTQ